jgi:hypothetical protein
MNHDPRFAAAGGARLPAARQVAEVDTFRPASATEHARLTDGTADLWRELVHLCMETPCNP